MATSTGPKVTPKEGSRLNYRIEFIDVSPKKTDRWPEAEEKTLNTANY